MIKMGAYLKENEAIPEVLISSTASRAFYTALFFCDQMKIDEGRIRLSQDLFHAGPAQIIHEIRKAPKCNTLAVFGHNPGFTLAVNALTNTNLDNLPTCGVFGISFDIDRWSEVKEGSGKKLFYYYPKGL